MNHTVDVNANNHGGIRWYELRQIQGEWSLYQEGTYAPDDQSRFFGSMAMDYQGNIGLAYSVSGSNTYPSLRYTGRMATDETGIMTINEDVIIDGSSSQTGSNRYGDYSQMTLDPLDDATFWFTGEYIGNNGNCHTRIASFKLANDFEFNISPTNLLSPNDGVLGPNETITIEVSNYGLSPVSNFNLEYRVDDGEWITEQFNETIEPGLTASYSFLQTADLSIQGNHIIEIHTDLINDMYDWDDYYTQNVYHNYTHDVGISNIISPSNGIGLSSNENIILQITNYGTEIASNFTVTYSINDNDIIEENYTDYIGINETVEFQFETTWDFSIPGNYIIEASTQLEIDQNNDNNSYSKTIEHEECLPIADCSEGDGFVYVEFNTISNYSGCGNNGYTDFTNISTTVYIGNTYELTVESDYDEQFMTVWIDYNDNMFFEDDEIVINNLYYDWETSTNISIPLDCQLGSHLLRLKACWDESSNEVCEDCDYGETEDYIINISSSTAINNLDLDLNEIIIMENEIIINLSDINDEVELYLYNSLGQILYTESIVNRTHHTIKIPMKHYAKGVYTIVLKNGDDKLLSRVLY